MSAERTAEEWGRLAVSIPGAPECWGDLEGRDGHDAPGAVCADGTWWLPDSADGMFMDVDHPATAGCLLVLLGKEAWRTVHDERGWFAFVDGPGPAECPVEGTGHLLPCVDLARTAITVADTLGYWPGGGQ